MIKLALADDHMLFREGIRFLVDNMEGIELVLEASNGKELLEEIEQNQPDVLLLDLDMPVMDGLEVIKELKPKMPDLGIIVLTMHSDPKMVAYLMELGANSYLLKDTSAEEFKKAIEHVKNEGFYFNPMVSQAMLSGLKGNARKKPILRNFEELTSRELEVLELICREFTAKEIAEKLFISPRTAEGHRRSLIEKLGVKNTAGLIVKAIKEGIIQI